MALVGDGLVAEAQMTSVATECDRAKVQARARSRLICSAEDAQSGERHRVQIGMIGAATLEATSCLVSTGDRARGRLCCQWAPLRADRA